MKSYSSRELIKLAESKGWMLINITGSHHVFKHQNIQKNLAIPHPKKNLSMGTAKNILKTMEGK